MGETTATAKASAGPVDARSLDLINDGMGFLPREHAIVDHPEVAKLHREAKAVPVTQTTRLSVNGSTSVVVTPPLPCGLAGCVAELHITSKHGDTQRVHLNAQQRRELVIGLGGQER